MQAQMLTEMFTSVSQRLVQRLNRDKLKITILGCVVVVLLNDSIYMRTNY